MFSRSFNFTLATSIDFQDPSTKDLNIVYRHPLALIDLWLPEAGYIQTRNGRFSQKNSTV